MKPKLTEVQIADAAARWLESQAWTVYEEVTTPFGNRPDLVGMAGRARCVVECKTSGSMQLISQALRSLRAFSNLTWVCVPHAKVEDLRTICVALGIGVLTVHEGGLVTEAEHPRWQGHGRRKLAVTPHEDCRRGVATHAAGSRAGGQSTPFSRTCRVLRDLVEREPGITIKDAVAKITHHYATPQSARATLPVMIRQGFVDGVRIEMTGRAITLHPVAKATG